MAHVADDDHFIDLMPVEDRLEFGLAKRIDVVLEDHRFVALILRAVVDLRTFAAWAKERRIVVLELMTDVHHQVAPLTKPIDHTRRLCSSGLDVGECPPASREIVVLDINDHQCLLVQAIAHDLAPAEVAE
ncbi:hypothetical protein D3C73_1336040 [compost metagenome]